MSANIEVGKAYVVTHSRKGRFSLLVTGVTDEWVTGEIIDGTATAMMAYNVREKGEEITVRKSFCRFSEIVESEGGEL